MSLLLLIDGYNIAQPIAPRRQPDPRWLEKTRQSLLRELAKHLSSAVRRKTCVVFDASAPPKGRADRFTQDEISVRFAVGYPSADDLLEELIAEHPTPKRLMVVSSDHRIQIAAKRRKSKHCDSEPWMDDLTDGNVRLAISLDSLTGDDPTASSPAGGAGQGGLQSGSSGQRSAPEKKPRIEDAAEVDQWMRTFGFDDD